MKHPNVMNVYLITAFILTYFSSWLPDISIIGYEDVRISSTLVFSVLNGILLGPYWVPFITFSGILTYLLTNSNYSGSSTVTMMETPSFWHPHPL